jgi:Na+(H+)/acetate symporter ActP
MMKQKLGDLMSKKTRWSILLVSVGVIVGCLVIFGYAMSGGKTGITLIFMVPAITCIMAGSVLAFSRLLDRHVGPVIDEFNQDIEDDLQDIKEHRITNTIWMVIIICIALLAFSYFVLRLHKMEAMWGPIPVIIPTFVGMGLLAVFIPRTRWFQTQIYTPMWIFLIPTVGFILTIGVGLNKTENLAILSATRQESAGYNYNRSTGIILQEASGIGNLGFDLDIPDCDGDECAVFLVIGLIILTLVLVIGSAMIPHFWLLSGSILLGIMVLIAIHDLRIRRSIIEEK